VINYKRNYPGKVFLCLASALARESVEGHEVPCTVCRVVSKNQPETLGGEYRRAPWSVDSPIDFCFSAHF
jgi:hypothetical protein